MDLQDDLSFANEIQVQATRWTRMDWLELRIIKLTRDELTLKLLKKSIFSREEGNNRERI